MLKYFPYKLYVHMYIWHMVHMYMCTLYFPYIRTYVCMYGIWYIYELFTVAQTPFIAPVIQ